MQVSCSSFSCFLWAIQYGGDHLATANTTVQTGEMAIYLSYCCDSGFKLIKDLA